ncbi:hypothetical protein HanXRQr2_Chr16g0751361 [Helianthus annuus]|uniref:Uncharacterized protein n=1 Tax=Helianthus annuus TaxID=4232 RepID=A0A9K3DRA7_HELAN|nr:hypothetical protein HanXRQr2_Chr16g0751361 [Helianthus annuus]KAJ0438333.1 hypothetical protein HanHA300_Chr16g0612761 [Helianthus annuus]KAJ0460659.1 hypothetical protein HanHA89_Chr16g0663361 [Helianthus annuus]KAJ0821425.1 hypothetical protein HanPSC8_Chr16g0720041 [Helianthus annuus]
MYSPFIYPEPTYNKVFEVVEEARNCYIDGSIDEEFARMMLRDACFVLFFIECISCAKNKVLLNNEHLGVLGFANVVRDIFLLENQIPFVVLKVLSYFISLKVSLGLGSTHSSKWSRKGEKVTESSEDYNYVKRNRSFASVTELKAKGIFLKRICNESSEDIKFLSHFCYGELELVRRAVSSNTKAIYLNMIAYEMCAHNPNDFRVSTYIRVMKSLVIHRDDVKELRNHNILLHSLGRDEEVVKMYDEIDVPTVNLYMLISSGKRSSITAVASIRLFENYGV